MVNAEMLLSSAVVAGVVAGVFSVLQAWLQRKWKKADSKDEAIKNLVNAQKIIMMDRVFYLGGKHIAEGEIGLREKDTLKEMYQAYKALGGNGHLDTVMDEIEKLPVA